MRAIITAICYSSILLLSASCSGIVDTRGHQIDALDLKQIVEDQSNKDDIRALLGSPSTESMYGDDIWYYIATTRERRGFYAPEVVKQNVLAVTYNADGTVSQYDQFTIQDGKLVEFVEKTTPTAGKSLNAIEQLLGNIGRFNAPGSVPGAGAPGRAGP